jgi:hypothetical protein
MKLIFQTLAMFCLMTMASQSFARDEVGAWDTDQIDHLITKADFILVHHGHYDHLGDAPYAFIRNDRWVETLTVAAPPEMNKQRGVVIGFMNNSDMRGT